MYILKFSNFMSFNFLIMIKHFLLTTLKTPGVLKSIGSFHTNDLIIGYQYYFFNTVIICLYVIHLNRKSIQSNFKIFEILEICRTQINLDGTNYGLKGRTNLF